VDALLKVLSQLQIRGQTMTTTCLETEKIGAMAIDPDKILVQFEISINENGR